MFENKLINGVYCSRYIASYIKKTGDHRFSMLRDWLKNSNYKWRAYII